MQGDISARGLGWVDFNLECSTAYPIPAGLTRICNLAEARWCNTQIKVNSIPTKVREQMRHPIQARQRENFN